MTNVADDLIKAQLEGAGAKLKWSHTPADRVTAALSFAGPYQIAHRGLTKEPRGWRGENHELAYRPEGIIQGVDGKTHQGVTNHHHLGTFKKAELAKQAAQDHADGKLKHYDPAHCYGCNIDDERKAKTEEHLGFEKLKDKLAAKGDVGNPAAVAAAIGRKKFGKKKFQRMAAAGKR